MADQAYDESPFMHDIEEHLPQQVFEDAANHQSPYVRDGAGAGKGLSELEHVQWARFLNHEMVVQEPPMEWDMQRALKQEMLLEHQEIYELRETELKRLVARSAWLLQEKAGLMLSVPPALQNMLEDVNLPLIQVLLREVFVHDHKLFENLVEGFPVLGLLPDVNYGCKPMPEAKRHMLSQEWLRQIREANNRKVISKIKESEHSEDVWQQTIQDAMLDGMTWPIEIQDYHILHTTLCRRIAVREYREDKAAWRTRTVDHFSECFVNQATTSTWTKVCDDLSTLHKLLMTYMKNGEEPQLWKQDIASAWTISSGLRPNRQK